MRKWLEDGKVFLSLLCLLIASAGPVSSIDKRMLTTHNDSALFPFKTARLYDSNIGQCFENREWCQCPSKVFDTVLACLSHNSRFTRNSAGADPNLPSQLAQSAERHARGGESGSRGCFCPL